MLLRLRAGSVAFQRASGAGPRRLARRPSPLSGPTGAAVTFDGEFVKHPTSGRIDQLVIEAVVTIAQGLGKETIAEFVTSEDTNE